MTRFRTSAESAQHCEATREGYVRQISYSGCPSLGRVPVLTCIMLGVGAATGEGRVGPYSYTWGLGLCGTGHRTCVVLVLGLELDLNRAVVLRFVAWPVL